MNAVSAVSIDWQTVCLAISSLTSILLGIVWRDLRSHIEQLDKNTTFIKENYVLKSDIADEIEQIRIIEKMVVKIDAEKVSRNELNERFTNFENTLLIASQDIRDSIARFNVRIDKIDSANVENLKLIFTRLPNGAKHE